MPSESRLPLRVVKRDVRLEGGAEKEKVVLLGVLGREGGCEERAKRKRDVRCEARLLGGESAARAKCVERGVEGRSGTESLRGGN